jgi:hypothetical protein
MSIGFCHLPAPRYYGIDCRKYVVDRKMWRVVMARQWMQCKSQTGRRRALQTKCEPEKRGASSVGSGAIGGTCRDAANAERKSQGEGPVEMLVV